MMRKQILLIFYSLRLSVFAVKKTNMLFEDILRRSMTCLLLPESYLELPESYLDLPESYLDLPESYLELRGFYLDLPGFYLFSRKNSLIILGFHFFFAGKFSELRQTGCENSEIARKDNGEMGIYCSGR